MIEKARNTVTTSRSYFPAVDELEERLQQLVAEAREYPPKTVQRKQRLNEIVRLVSRSGKLWREEAPYYQDALQQTWLYLCRNLENYDSSRANIITWLDNHLKWRLEDFRQAQQAELARRVSASEDSIDLIGNLPAPPEIPPILEAVRRWVETDPDGELSSIHVQGRPDVTCQILIWRRLPPEKRWSEIASEFNLSLSTAANFYKRQCLPRLRNFGKNQGYL